MIDHNQDGISHINVYSKAKTELGRYLSNFSDCHIHTEDGYFRTVEGYWFWLSTKDEALRTLPGWECKQLGKKLRALDFPKDPVFEEKISKAIIIKVIQNIKMKQLLIQSGTLPIFHYYIYNGNVIMVKEGLWMLSLIEFIREECQKGDL